MHAIGTCYFYGYFYSLLMLYFSKVFSHFHQQRTHFFLFNMHQSSVSRWESMLQGMLISSTLIPLCMFYCCIYLFLISMSSYDITDQIELQYYLSTNIESNIKHSYYILRMIIGISRIFDFRTLRVGVPTALKWDGFSTSAFTIDIRRKTSIRTIAFCEGKRCVLDVFIIVYCGKVNCLRQYGGTNVIVSCILVGRLMM